MSTGFQMQQFLFIDLQATYIFKLLFLYQVFF